MLFYYEHCTYPPYMYRVTHADTTCIPSHVRECHPLPKLVHHPYLSYVNVLISIHPCCVSMSLALHCYLCVIYIYSSWTVHRWRDATWYYRFLLHLHKIRHYNLIPPVLPLPSPFCSPTPSPAYLPPSSHSTPSLTLSLLPPFLYLFLPPSFQPICSLLPCLFHFSLIQDASCVHLPYFGTYPRLCFV